MSRGTTRPKKAKQNERPSAFFIVALGLGVVLVVTLFIYAVSHPAKPPLDPKKAPTATETTGTTK